jgi:alpha-mannosidase
MLKHPRITETRVARAIGLIKERIYGDRVPLAVEACPEEGEPAFPARIPETGYQPFRVGESWGPAWSTTWFRFTGTVPAAWSGRAVSALVRLGYNGTEGFGAEGLVWQDGQATRAINVNRADVPIADAARGGEEVSFHVEAAANPKVQTWVPFGKPEPAPGGPLFVLEAAALACFNPDAFALYLDLALAYATMMELAEQTPRRGQLLRACNDAANLLDPADPSTYAPARQALVEVFGKRNGGSAHEMRAHFLDATGLYAGPPGIRFLLLPGAAIRMDEGVLPRHLRGHPRCRAPRPMGAGRLDVGRGRLQYPFRRIHRTADSAREEFLPR